MTSGLRQALLFDQHALWLDAVETVLRGVGIEVVGKTVVADEVVPLVAARQPSLLVAEIDIAHSENEDSGCFGRFAWTFRKCA